MARAEVGQNVTIKSGTEVVSIQPRGQRFGVWSDTKQDWVFIGPLLACQAYIELDGELMEEDAE